MCKGTKARLRSEYLEWLWIVGTALHEVILWQNQQPRLCLVDLHPGISEASINCVSQNWSCYIMLQSWKQSLTGGWASPLWTASSCASKTHSSVLAMMFADGQSILKLRWTNGRVGAKLLRSTPFLEVGSQQSSFHNLPWSTKKLQLHQWKKTNKQNRIQPKNTTNLATSSKIVIYVNYKSLAEL